LGSFLKIEDTTIIEKLKKCYDMKINKDEDYEKIIDKDNKISPKSFLDDFWGNNLSHCNFYNASVLYKDLEKKSFQKQEFVNILQKLFLMV
jgi:hypothetical protein